MMQNEESKNLTAEALNAMTCGQAVITMIQGKAGSKFLPLCPSDHKGVSEQHIKDCKRPGKVPRIPNWPIRASSHLSDVHSWFEKWPDSNLGMLLGGNHGFVGFDADGEYGINKMEELFNHCIPSTWQFSTPGGGMRWLFQVPKGQSLRKLTDASPNGGHEELAFLADGHMTVMPPSQHQNGGQYLWVEGRGPRDVPLADLPAEVLEKLAQRRAPESLFLDDEDDTQVIAKDSLARPKSRFGEMLKKHAPHTPAVSNPDLQKIVKHCSVVRNAVAEQAQAGCNEELWHSITSMLVRAGCTEAALTFSKLSSKHDSHSEQRIGQMDAEGASATYGPTRCSTYGCSNNQINKCFVKARKNEEGEITNSPASFLLANDFSYKHTASEHSLNEALPDGYVIENGLLCEEVFYKGKSKTNPLANFLATPTKLTVKDDGLEKQQFYEIQGKILTSGKPLHPILVPADVFPTMQWVAQWGLEPNIFPGSTLRDKVRFVVQHQGRNATKESIYTHIGWKKINGKWIYLHGGGCIGADHVKVELDSRLQNYSLPEIPTEPVKAMKGSLDLLKVASIHVTLPLLAFIYLAPLREWLKQAELTPAFIFWLYGYTGTRKSSLAALFLCHFGSFTAKSLPASFKDTPNSIEKRASDCKDSILLVDDKHPTANPYDAKKMEQVAQYLLRIYGDLTGRSRMAPNATLRANYDARGLCLVTSEDLTSGGSSNARLFPAELKIGDVDLPKLTDAQKNAKLLAKAMAGYIDFLRQAMDEQSTEVLTNLFHEKRLEASQLNVHGRLVEAATSLYMGLYFGLKYASSIGAISSEHHEQLLTEGWELFLGIAKEQGEQVTEVRPTQRFIRIVSALLANGSIHTISTKPQPHDGVPKGGTHVGWHDRELFYLLPEVLYNTVSQFLSREGEQFPISQAMLWRQLADEGYIESEMDGKQKRTTKKKVVGDFRGRVLWLKVSALRGAETEGQEGQSTRVRRVQPTTHSMDGVFAPEDRGEAPTT